MSRYTLDFEDIKVGDIVVFEIWEANGMAVLGGRGSVTKVSPQQFKYTYDSGRGLSESTNLKTDGSRRGWNGQAVAHIDTPESKAEYEALQRQKLADELETDRRIKSAKEMQENLRATGLGRISVDGYGSFNMKIFCNEQEAQVIIDALHAAGVKL